MLKRSLKDIASTFYDPAFYARVRQERLDRPIKLTATLGVAGATVLMIVFYAAIIPFSNGAFVDKAEGLYPDDLVITLAKGQVSINQPEPYAIANPFAKSDDTESHNLVVFDTGDTLQGGTAANDTYVLVKKTYAIARDSSGERTTYFSEFATTSTTTITKADVVKIGTIIRPYVRPGILIGGLFVVVIGALCTAGFWLAFHLLYLLIPGVLVYMFGRFRLPQMLWLESYVVALYASMPVAVVTFLLHFLGIHWPIFFYTLLVMLVALVNLTQVPNAVPAALPALDKDNEA